MMTQRVALENGEKGVQNQVSKITNWYKATLWVIVTLFLHMCALCQQLRNSGWMGSSEIAYLPLKYKALGSIPSTTKKKGEG